MKLFSFNHEIESTNIRNTLISFVALTRGNEVQEEAKDEFGQIVLRKWSGKPVPVGCVLVDANGDAQSPASWVAGRECHRWLQGKVSLQTACLAIVGLRARCIDSRAVQARAVAQALWCKDSIAIDCTK